MRREVLLLTAATARSLPWRCVGSVLRTAQMRSVHAAQVVFWDMRDAFLERLYRHRVADARIAPLLSDLDGVRGCAARQPTAPRLLPII